MCAYPDADEKGHGVILRDIISVVNGIHSATANMECCSVVITDLAPHHDTSFTPSILLTRLSL